MDHKELGMVLGKDCMALEDIQACKNVEEDMVLDKDYSMDHDPSNSSLLKQTL